MSNTPLLRCTGVRKNFRLSPKVAPLPVLQGVDFELATAERVAVVGASGSGKSTLLTLMGGLDQPDEGNIFLQGSNWQKMNEAECNLLRNRALGFIYQHHHLLDEFSAVENVAMPLYIRRMGRAEAETKATQMLERVGLNHRLNHRPSELSGGERQRVAVARSLVTEPACVLADEPTGNLDRANAEAVFALLLELNQERGCALVVVTHDERLAAQTQRQLQLIDGKLQPLN